MWLIAEDLQGSGDDRFLHHWIQGTVVPVIKDLSFFFQ